MERANDNRTGGSDAAAGIEERHPVTPERDRAMASGTHLDLKALRLAVHGWWLGNPLVYKPGVADLYAVARELASAGAASGTLVVSDAHRSGDAEQGIAAIHPDLVRAVLILRPALPRTPLGMAAALAIADVAQATLGRACAVRWRWEVVLRDGQSTPRLCRVSVERHEDVALVGLRLALGRLREASQESGQPATAIFARPDWREVFLARVLHALDNRLRALLAA